ncbi:hypothetical protein EVAR_85389_1 [Eumeta japonica]|uniref:Nucleic-acid-binding protein from transposon X-element n=1 Tax=Eumeta variegata TaxID=151549 RepID=A0A4C1SMA1_EUMVA|nr:hypothetical protein EVAR_85389_1 [Eumeta japonica]
MPRRPELLHSPLCQMPRTALNKECKRSKDSGDVPECVNCNSEGHPASYKGCPKPHFFKTFAPATNAWSRTPARAVSEPAKAIREPQAGLSQTGISCRPTRRRHPHHHVDAEDGQKPGLPNWPQTFGKQGAGKTA